MTRDRGRLPLGPLRGRRLLPHRKPIGALARREERWFYVFIAPWLLGFILFGIGPILASLGLAFTDYGLAGWPNWPRATSRGYSSRRAPSSSHGPCHRPAPLRMPGR